jgi:hypothetical protein
MTHHSLGETEDVLLNRKEASRELATLGIRRAPSTLAKIFCTRSDGPPCTHLGRTPYYPRSKLHAWARSQLTGLRSSSSQPRRQGGWDQDADLLPRL